MHSIVLAKFQKDLIVWKPCGNTAAIASGLLFQKDLIVWKLIEYKVGSVGVLIRFQKNLIVWKRHRRQ